MSIWWDSTLIGRIRVKSTLAYGTCIFLEYDVFSVAVFHARVSLLLRECHFRFPSIVASDWCTPRSFVSSDYAAFAFILHLRIFEEFLFKIIYSLKGWSGLMISIPRILLIFIIATHLKFDKPNNRSCSMHINEICWLFLCEIYKFNAFMFCSICAHCC